MDRSGWDAASWVDQELAGSTFKDERLGQRLRKLLVQMADAVGKMRQAERVTMRPGASAQSAASIF